MASIIKRTDKPTIVRGMGSNAVLKPSGIIGPTGPVGPPGGSDAAFAGWVNDPASETRDALSATYAARADTLPKWKANTAYAAGDRVVSPDGDNVTAKTAFTSGTTYDPASWTPSAAFSSPVAAAERKHRAQMQAMRATTNLSLATFTGPSANGAASSIASAVEIEAVLNQSTTRDVNTLFTYLGARVAALGTVNGEEKTVVGTGISWPSGNATRQLYSVLFNHEGATALEIKVHSNSVQYVNAFVDGQPCLAAPIKTTSTGFIQRFYLTLQDTRRHEIAVQFWGNVGQFRGITVGPAAIVSKITRPLGRRLVIATDSQGEPSGPAPLYLGYHFRWPEQLGRLLGIEDIHVTPMGSTGYRANSGGSRYTIGQRLQADVLDANPTDVLFHFGQNDNGTVDGVVFSEANFRAAVVDVLSRTRTALPYANIIVNTQLHPYSGNSAVIYDVLRQEAANYGATLINLKGFLTGTGNEGAAGSGNRDELISSDDSHLSVRGHDALAPYIAARIETGLNYLAAPVGHP